uniref:BUD13 homolog n=1 Tax=Cacopsylla melanoneura TaxID=428564 RepID=A0A8D8S4R7_9HEMI
MTLQSVKIDQKEYLKKYLSGATEEKKKKKKKTAIGTKRVKIIDDDLDLKNMKTLDNGELELYQLSEDAPVIAGIVDERPLEVQQADKYKDVKRWKVVTGGSDDDVRITDKSEQMKKSKHMKARNKNDSDSDVSPPRNSKQKSKKPGADFSPPRKSRKDANISDLSPPRKSKNKFRKNSDSDISPPRKSNKSSRQNSDPDIFLATKSSKKSRNDSDSDVSPPRKSSKKARENYDSDISPPRKSSKKSRQNSDPDISPPRKSSKKSRKNSNSDISPPRKLRKEENSSSRHQRNKGNDSDLSPPRKSSKKSRQNSDSDFSPPRRNKKESHSSNRHKSQRSRGSDSDLSPQRKPKQDLKSRRNGGSDSDLSPPRKSAGNKMKKTLDGKHAGLQDAKQLVRENQEFKQREDELFNKMKASVSGAEASTVLRDRKTGKVRDLEEERRIARKKEEKDSEHKDKYDRWGRGVKQGEEFQARIANDLHEMSKPLARYKDDEDLERDLKETLRAEDPMLQYVLSKKEQSEAESKPKYKGSWPPNRFNIPPGYRWDGVDRSNGYEKQYFLNKSSKKAVEEEAYHWSCSDL